MTSLTRRQVAAGAAASAAALSGQARAKAPTRGKHVLWYAKPAVQWVEALPIGNGRLGAMVFGDPWVERLQLNEHTLWSGGPYDPVNPRAQEGLGPVRAMIAEGRFADAEKLANETLVATPPREMAYQPFGDLTVRFVGQQGTVGDYRRSLDLDDAIAETTFVVDGVRYRRRVLASPVDQVIALEITASKPGALNLDVALTSAQTVNQVALEGRDGLKVFGRNNAEGAIAGALTFCGRAKVVTKGGTVNGADGQLSVRGATRAVVYVAMATSYRRYDDVGGDPDAITRQQIERVAAKPFDRVARDATAAHRALFDRVSLDLGGTTDPTVPTDQRLARNETTDDPALAELYFQYARYLLIACSRPGGQAANLQGLWNDQVKPPWGSNYTININTQMNYWPAEAGGLAECAEPLFALIKDLSERGAATARKMYGARGWVAHHNTDLWRGTAPFDHAKAGLWPTGGAWLCLHLWDRYDYGRDKRFLARAYPLMRGACLFFLDTLQTDAATGWLVTSPSVSPENRHGFGSTLCAGPTMDMQILRDLFDHTREAARILDLDPDLRADLARTRERLAPTRVGAQGQIMEWKDDWDAVAADPKHRHVSHLYGLFPSWQMDPAAHPDLAAAARRTLETRGDKTTGWAIAWRINLWARLKDGDHAHDVLRLLLARERTYPNLFDAHPPFQIDGNFGGAAAIMEMLVQSKGEILDLLPALPAAWPTGSLRGVRVRNAGEMDLSWRDGRLESVTLRCATSDYRTLKCGEVSRRIFVRAGERVTLAGPSLQGSARAAA
ncbi:glycoside hydrolase family 95 protein [Caulobacter sp. 1776]|uniref:glycoside hydrolase family 95 protein n=1 Tax=Caulobacter sp. 1776 TaxID=3156420 RepID=UPI00339104E9